MWTISASDARANLHQVLHAVSAGSEVVITRRGAPVAVLVRPDVLRDRRVEAALNRAAKVREALAAGRTRPLSGPGLSPERAEELIAEIRAPRGSALTPHR